MDDRTKGLIEHLRKIDPGLEVIETPQFIPVHHFTPISQEKTIMAENERDTHFALFAESHYLELSDLFSQMYACQILNDHSGEDQARYDIKELLAQRAYDLVYHASCHITESMTHWYADDMVSEIPDLTEWPDTSPHEIPDQPTHWPKPTEP
jgi:hypothetical protein